MTPWTARTPRTPGTSSSHPIIYSLARQLFTLSSSPGRLVERDAERDEVQRFVESHIAGKKGGCLYVSGPPGTGKSALVNEILSSLPEEVENVEKVYLNCMSIKDDAKTIYGNLVAQLLPSTLDASEIPFETLQKLFLPRGRAAKTIYLVSLDEIDHLLTHDADTVTQLFEWSLQPRSRLILIGIANALDLTDRFLPRLKAKNLQPDLIPFMPYTAPQVAAVITAKLRTLSTQQVDAIAQGLPPFIHPTAITFLSKKVASSTGDLRKAFELCRQAISLVESEVRADHQAKILQLTPSKPSPLAAKLVHMDPSPPTPAASPVKSRDALAMSLATLTAETAPRVTIAHMSKVAAQLSRGTSATNRLAALNLQQKACLCALVVHERTVRDELLALEDPLGSSRSEGVGIPTIKRLYPRYTALCRQEGCLLSPLSATEFRDVVESLETFGVVSFGNAGAGKGRGRGGGLFAKLQPRKRSGGKEEARVSLVVDEKEVEEVCKGVAGGALMRMLFGGGAGRC